MIKMDELSQLPLEEISIQLEDTLEELENLKYQKAAYQLDDPVKIRHIKRDVARLKTVLREYDLGIRKSNK